MPKAHMKIFLIENLWKTSIIWQHHSQFGRISSTSKIKIILVPFYKHQYLRLILCKKWDREREKCRTHILGFPFIWNAHNSKEKFNGLFQYITTTNQHSYLSDVRPALLQFLLKGVFKAAMYRTKKNCIS